MCTVCSLKVTVRDQFGQLVASGTVSARKQSSGMQNLQQRLYLLLVQTGIKTMRSVTTKQ